MKKFEIIEGETEKEALLKVFEKGLRPATIEEVWKLREEGKIPDHQWYDSGTLWAPGIFRQVTREDAERIDEVYREGGRVLFLYCGNIGLVGDLSLYCLGRFVGVYPEDEYALPDDIGVKE